MKKFLKRVAILAGIAAAGYLAYFATAVAGIAFFPEVVGTCLNYVGIAAIGTFGIAAYKAIKDTVKDILAAKEEKDTVAAQKTEPQKEKEKQKENENQRVQHRTNERPQQKFNHEDQKKMAKRWLGKHRATKIAGGRNNQREAA